MQAERVTLAENQSPSGANYTGADTIVGGGRYLVVYAGTGFDATHAAVIQMKTPTGSYVTLATLDNDPVFASPLYLPPGLYRVVLTDGVSAAYAWLFRIPD